MKRTIPVLPTAKEAARRDQQAMIRQAADTHDMPSDSWVRRVSELEVRIFGLDAMETAGKPASQS